VFAEERHQLRQMNNTEIFKKKKKIKRKRKGYKCGLKITKNQIQTSNNTKFNIKIIDWTLLSSRSNQDSRRS